MRLIGRHLNASHVAVRPSLLVEEGFGVGEQFLKESLRSSPRPRRFRNFAPIVKHTPVTPRDARRILDYNKNWMGT